MSLELHKQQLMRYFIKIFGKINKYHINLVTTIENFSDESYVLHEICQCAFSREVIMLALVVMR